MDLSTDYGRRAWCRLLGICDDYVTAPHNDPELFTRFAQGVAEHIDAQASKLTSSEWDNAEQHMAILLAILQHAGAVPQGRDPAEMLAKIRHELAEFVGLNRYKLSILTGDAGDDAKSDKDPPYDKFKVSYDLDVTFTDPLDF